MHAECDIVTANLFAHLSLLHTVVFYLNECTYHETLSTFWYGAWHQFLVAVQPLQNSKGNPSIGCKIDGAGNILQFSTEIVILTTDCLEIVGSDWHCTFFMCEPEMMMTVTTTICRNRCPINQPEYCSFSIAREPSYVRLTYAFNLVLSDNSSTMACQLLW